MHIRIFVSNWYNVLLLRSATRVIESSFIYNDHCTFFYAGIQIITVDHEFKQPYISLTMFFNRTGQEDTARLSFQDYRLYIHSVSVGGSIYFRVHVYYCHFHLYSVVPAFVFNCTSGSLNATTTEKQKIQIEK